MTKRLQLLADIALVILFAGLTAAVLGIRFLNATNTPTGGDSASHVLYAWEYSRSLLFSGDILPWMPEVFTGFPFLSYYFPLPFMVIATLAKCIGFAPAFKWGGFAAALLLPGAAHVAGRRWFAVPWPAAVLGAVGAFTFLLHEQNSIWGGNLLSILSGEFAYSYGLLFALLACFAWARADRVRGGWVVAALLEAATGFSHGFTLLVVGFSTLLLLVESGELRRTFWMLLRGHLLAFCLLGGWLWPMLEMHGFTIPNDASFPISTWRDFFPLSLIPLFLAGVAALPFCMLNRSLRSSITPLQMRAMRYLAGAAAIAVLGFVAGDRLGLANIRFFPIAWLFSAIICGWLVGFVVSWMAASCQESPSSALPGTFSLGEKGTPSSPCPAGPARKSGEGIRQRLITYRKVLIQTLLTLALALGSLGWLAQTVQSAPHWALWNHAGLESKPQWHNLAQLFPAMKGSLWSPRLVFEHDPANNDLGSTRTLEALPMFLGGRPVLEGLYMESALVGPAVYQLQSELSAQPSSPLVRFPSGSLDPSFAAEHMRFMHADTVLLRSKEAQSAVEKSGLFQKIAASPPFALYRLRKFSSHLAEVVTTPIRIRPLAGWMDDSFSWFRTRSRFNSYLPVYGATAAVSGVPATARADADVRVVTLERERMHFTTNAIGAAHLIKVAWHPRWKLLSAGRLYFAGPGFMLVVPQERDIILQYGHTPVGYAGMGATVIAAALLLFFWVRRGKSPPPLTGPDGKNRSVPFFILFFILILLGCVWFALQSPERTYARAFKAFSASRYNDAAPLFKRAFRQRRAPAKKEEALFWLAKTEELGGHKEEALNYFLELADTYHGYWVPESLYTAVLLGRETGQGAKVEPYAARLTEEYPNSSWTGKLREMK